MSPILLCSVLFLAWAFSPSAAQTSCRGSCGNEYNRGNMCQCDYGCLSYGECCKDYESQCTTRNSCRGRCGENFKRGRLCSCDADCVEFKQCCPDFKQHCNEEETEETEEVNGAAGASATVSLCNNVNANKPKDESLIDATETPLSFSEGNDPDLYGPNDEFSNYEAEEAAPNPAHESTSGYDSTAGDLLDETTVIPRELVTEAAAVSPQMETTPSDNDLTQTDVSTSAINGPSGNSPDETTDFSDDTSSGSTSPPRATVSDQLSNQGTVVSEVVTEPTTTAHTEELQTIEQKVNPPEASSDTPEVTTKTPSSTSASTESTKETTTAPTTVAIAGDTISDPNQEHPNPEDPNIQQSSDAVTTHAPSPSDATQGDMTDDIKPAEPTDSPLTTTKEPTNPEPAEPTDSPLTTTKEPTNPEPAEPTDSPLTTTAEPTNPKPAGPTDGPLTMTQEPTRPEPADPSDSPLTMTQEPAKPSAGEPTSKPQVRPEPQQTTPAKPTLQPEAKPQNPDDTQEYQGDDSHDTNLCSGRPVSGVTTLRNGTIVVFRGHYFWLLDSNRVPGPPRGITQVWGVPSPIDTVFTRCNCQGKTYIFKGSRYWRFENDVLDGGYPKIIHTGFDGLRGHVTAALSVPQYQNRRESVYFFKRGGQVQKYSYQFGTSPTCGKKPQISIYAVRNRVARQAVSLLGPTINIRKSWKGFPTTITAAVSVPSRREPDGYRYYVFSRSKSYNVRMDGQRPAIAAPGPNTSPQSNNFLNCPGKV